jgi:YfiR/HmsC-like
MRVIRFIAACLISVSLTIPMSAQTAGSVASSEYLIKAGFTYNFAKLMQWPEKAFPQQDSPIVIGILGADPFGNTLREVLTGKNVNGRSFVIKHLKFGAELKDCNILFVSASETAHLDEILRLVRGLPILTIGETPSFARRGGIINFILEDDKVHFEVNVEAAKQADIVISSRLLTLARIVPQTTADGSRVP